MKIRLPSRDPAAPRLRFDDARLSHPDAARLPPQARLLLVEPPVDPFGLHLVVARINATATSTTAIRTRCPP